MVELSIDEALQKGIEAHRNGELQLADRYYTAIIKAQPNHPEANHNMGVLAVSLGKLEVGLPFLQTALKANPKKSLFWLSLLDTLLKLENYGEAKKVLKQAKASGVSGEKIDQFTELLEENNGKHEEADTPKVDAGPTPEQLKELTNLFHSGQLDDVVKLADKLLKTFPKSVSLLNILGAAFGGLKQYESAIKHYQHALELSPNSAEIYYNLGVAFCAVQKTSDAIESYETACKIKPDYAQAYNNLGVVLGSTGSTKKAISSYRKAIQADTNYAEAHNNLGIALSKTGQTEEAVECYKRAIELKPNYSEAYNNLSALLVELKDLDGAIKHYNHAIKIKPNYAEAHNNLGIALSKTGQTEGAIKNYERAIELKPNYAEAYNNLGTLQAELGKLSEAIVNHKTALKIKPDYAEVYNNLGIALSKTGETEEAIKSYERAIELKPDYAEAYNNLGVAYSKVTRIDEALSAFNTALTLNPRSCDAYNNLGNAYAELGELDPARSSFDKAIELNPHYAEAHHHLSAITNYSQNKSNFNQMLEMDKCGNLSDHQLCQIKFGIAKAYSDIDEVELSYQYYEQGNAIRKRLLGYHIDTDKTLFSILEKTQENFFNNTLSKPDQKGDAIPIFILGMPRSGTTLVEQIVSSHDEVTGAGELDFCSRYSSSLYNNNIDTGAVTEFREQYLAHLNKVSLGKKFVTDKMPQNFRFIPLICASLPEAKIIHVTREAGATCWSNFKHHFATNGLGYCYDLQDLTQYFKMYQKLMDIWYEKYPSKIITCNYEKLTRNFESETQNLIKRLGLSWDDKCLNPHENKRTVKTASQGQIRKKVYAGSSDEWKKFKPYLKGVFDSL